MKRTLLILALLLATEIATKSPVSLRAAKRALRTGVDVDLASGLRIEAQAWEDAAFSADRVEGALETLPATQTRRLHPRSGARCAAFAVAARI